MKHDVEPLFGSRALAEWVREGRPTELRVRAFFPRLWWHAFWFEHNWRTQVHQLDRTPLPEDPVFIIGLWRSGTTAFHELLAEVTGWTTPQTWQCFNPSTCFLSRRPADASITRPMDQGRITTRSSQEDEFALLLLGEPSLYRAFIDPRRLRTCSEDLWSSNEGRLERWRDFLRGITQGAPGGRLLLKSPSHTFRLSPLRTLFPRAKFIWVARHPGEVLPSNFKMWRAMMGRYGLWGCPPGILESFLEDMLRACARVLTRCLDEMPPEGMLWVDFEELRADPKGVLVRVLQFLEPDCVDKDAFARNLERALKQCPVYEGAETSLGQNEAAEALQKLMVCARKRFGTLPGVA